jgi:hypothetical protein
VSPAGRPHGANRTPAPVTCSQPTPVIRRRAQRHAVAAAVRVLAKAGDPAVGGSDPVELPPHVVLIGGLLAQCIGPFDETAITVVEVGERLA